MFGSTHPAAKETKSATRRDGTESPLDPTGCQLPATSRRRSHAVGQREVQPRDASVTRIGQPNSDSSARKTPGRRPGPCSGVRWEAAPPPSHPDGPSDLRWTLRGPTKANGTSAAKRPGRPAAKRLAKGGNDRCPHVRGRGATKDYGERNETRSRKAPAPSRRRQKGTAATPAASGGGLRGTWSCRSLTTSCQGSLYSSSTRLSSRYLPAARAKRTAGSGGRIARGSSLRCRGTGARADRALQAAHLLGPRARPDARARAGRMAMGRLRRTTTHSEVPASPVGATWLRGRRGDGRASDSSREIPPHRGGEPCYFLHPCTNLESISPLHACPLLGPFLPRPSHSNSTDVLRHFAAVFLRVIAFYGSRNPG